MVTAGAPAAGLDRYAGTDNLERAALFSDPPATAMSSWDAGQSLEPGVQVVVLTLDKPEFIVPLVAELARERDLLVAAGASMRLAIGDTGSTDPDVLALYEELPPWAVVERDLPYHFSRTNNVVAGRHPGLRQMLFLNNDVSFANAPGAVAAMLAEFDHHPGTGAVGLSMDYPDGTVQHIGLDVLRSGHLRGFPWHPGAGQRAHHEAPRSWAAIGATGACLMVRSDLFAEYGGFDEGYRKECQDVDLCLTIRRDGHHVRIVDAGPAVHHENGTREPGEESWPDRSRFMRRWETFIEASYL